jgi:prepilin-type N-terminal cleavage/methylation domain-containing protein
MGACVGDQRGLSLLELLIAAAIGVVILTAAVAAIARTAEAARAVPDAADRAQTLRVAVDALARDIQRAGASAGPPLAGLVPAIVPARLGVDADLSATSDRITVLYREANAASARLAAPMLASDTGVPIDTASCPIPACGFRPGDRAIVIDEDASDGAYDVFTVEDAGAAGVWRAPSEGVLTNNHAASAVVAAIVERSYFLDRSDPANVRLMRSDGEQPAMPVAEGLQTLSFTYYGAADPGTLPSRIGAGTTCAFAPGSPPVPRLALLADPSPAPLTAAMLSDGPVCGAPGREYDGDLLRIRRVRMRVTVRTGGRGALPSGAVLDVTPRNLGVGDP